MSKFSIFSIIFVVLVILAVIGVYVWAFAIVPRQEQQAFEWLCEQEGFDIGQMDGSCDTKFCIGETRYYLQIWNKNGSGAVASYIVFYNTRTNRFYKYLPYGDVGLIWAE